MLLEDIVYIHGLNWTNNELEEIFLYGPGLSSSQSLSLQKIIFYDPKYYFTINLNPGPSLIQSRACGRSLNFNW
jgi:hypothetical protein